MAVAVGAPPYSDLVRDAFQLQGARQYTTAEVNVFLAEESAWVTQFLQQITFSDENTTPKMKTYYDTVFRPMIHEYTMTIEKYTIIGLLKSYINPITLRYLTEICVMCATELIPRVLIEEPLFTTGLSEVETAIQQNISAHTDDLVEIEVVSRDYIAAISHHDFVTLIIQPIEKYHKALSTILYGNQDPSKDERYHRYIIQQQRKRLNIPLVSNDAFISILGQGSFGTIVSPMMPNAANIDMSRLSNPRNRVSKVYSRKKNYNTALHEDQLLEQLLPGVFDLASPHSAPYRFKNIREFSPKITSKLRHPSYGFANTNEIHCTHMPNMGVNIREVLDTQNPYAAQLRLRPFHELLEGFHRLLYQTKELDQIRYVHSDVREMNVMVHPTTGNMTIIDFDFLNPRDTWYDQILNHRFHFSFYAHPPEMLYYPILEPTIDLATYSNINDTHADYDAACAAIGSSIQSMLYMIRYTKQQYAKRSVNTSPWMNYYYSDHAKYETEIDTENLTSRENNMGYICSRAIQQHVTIKEIIGQEMARYVDNYRLGIVCLDLCNAIFPGSMEQHAVDADTSVYRAYPTKSLHMRELITDTLQQLYRVWSSISNLRIEDRMDPLTAYQTISDVMRHYHQNAEPDERLSVCALQRLPQLPPSSPPLSPSAASSSSPLLMPPSSSPSAASSSSPLLLPPSSPPSSPSASAAAPSSALATTKKRKNVANKNKNSNNNNNGRNEGKRAAARTKRNKKGASKGGRRRQTLRRHPHRHPRKNTRKN